MQGIMADNDVQGQIAVLMRILESEPWRDIWISLHLPLRSFEDLELPQDISDAGLWHVCQQRQIILITGNRNQDGPDSLETTLRTYTTAGSLPVFTLASTDRVMMSREYAQRVAERLLEYLVDIDNYRGTGRLYLP